MTAPLVEQKVGTHYGHSWVNICLAILVEAKKTNHPMWEAFKQSEYYRKNGHNCDSLSVACWVAEYTHRDLKEAK